MKAYKAPRNQGERLAEAESAIARLRATLAQGSNRFGAYGDNCRASIRRWEDTAKDALAKIGAGVSKL